MKNLGEFQSQYEDLVKAREVVVSLAKELDLARCQVQHLDDQLKASRRKYSDDLQKFEADMFEVVYQ